MPKPVVLCHKRLQARWDVANQADSNSAALANSLCTKVEIQQEDWVFISCEPEFQLFSGF